MIAAILCGMFIYLLQNTDACDDESFGKQAQSVFSGLLDAGNDGKDDSIQAFECADSSYLRYYVNDMQNGESFDVKNEKHRIVFKHWRKHQEILNRLSSVGKTFADFRYERLSKMSQKMQKKIGLKKKDLSFEKYINEYSDCSSYIDALEAKVAPSLNEVVEGCSSPSSAGFTFTIGIEFAIIVGFSEGAGFAFKIADGSRQFIWDEAWIVTTGVGLNGYMAVNYFDDYANIPGESYLYTIELDASLVSLGFSLEFNWNDEQISIAASASLGYGVSLPVSLGGASAETHVYDISDFSQFKNQQKTLSTFVKFDEIRNKFGFDTNIYVYGGLCIILVVTIWCLVRVLFVQKKNADYTVIKDELEHLITQK